MRKADALLSYDSSSPATTFLSIAVGVEPKSKLHLKKSRIRQCSRKATSLEWNGRCLGHSTVEVNIKQTFLHHLYTCTFVKHAPSVAAAICCSFVSQSFCSHSDPEMTQRGEAGSNSSVSVSPSNLCIRYPCMIPAQTNLLVHSSTGSWQRTVTVNSALKCTDTSENLGCQMAFTSQPRLDSTLHAPADTYVILLP